MRYLFFLYFLAFFGCQGSETTSSAGLDLIQHSIAFHDPQGHWKNFKGTLEIQDSLPPGRESRQYRVTFDNSQSKMEYLKNDLHFTVWNDSVTVLLGEIEKDRALMLRNYYTYLWGLPMKLLDPGTNFKSEPQKEVLNGEEYWVVEVPYEKDTWYFYLHPTSYELKAYKFYQDLEAQKGEIIYLDGLMEIGGMKIPQNRTWYRTEVDEFLGTDQLIGAYFTD
ncbi:hypothetical protein E4S40_02850 [Algoriphagus kandeliae]|uniref:Uncharacterized protein n=1 Tax=Algoriphagus kandeliae TaxID=2562278 RepID=A0A4Y9R2R9_9BACT|nr:DUF6503 family protein [Algoriphagus kandeliae]TFV97605.1 hypothetical protein E4S40_02850 [Algoriphagus kandeliae]